MFVKKTEAMYSGVVERIDVVQESSGDAGRTCYAVLLKGEFGPRLLDTEQVVGHDEFQAVYDLRVRIALTCPGDSIRVKTKGHYTVEFENDTLSDRLSQSALASA